MAASDFRTNALIRQVLARHWIDIQELHFGSFRGTVRFSGKLCHANGRLLDDGGPGLLEGLEAEIRRIDGVRAVYFDYANWMRDECGRWIPVQTAAEYLPGEVEPETLADPQVAATPGGDPATEED